MVVDAQIQIGQGIEGEDYGDGAGSSLCMPDANTVAIGSHGNNQYGTDAGQTRVFTWNGSLWIQKGLSIYGDSNFHQSGQSVTMPDANTLGIGAPGDYSNAGSVKVFSWNGSAWQQKGGDIIGQYGGDYSGYSVHMPDANTVAIGSIWNSTSFIQSGQVRIFSWNGNAWTQKGPAINGEAAYDLSGRAISMPDANTVAIGAPYNDGNGADAGHVRIYTWTGSFWQQHGLDINGEAAGDWFGIAVSMPDPSTLAIGAPHNDAMGADGGHVRVYTWSGSSWQQKGSDIDGEGGSESGFSVHMPDGNTVAIGAPHSSQNQFEAGIARVYTWNGANWIQKGSSITGETMLDHASVVYMTNNETIAVGAPSYSTNSFESGQVRVFSFHPSMLTEEQPELPFTLYPNPGKDMFYLHTASYTGDLTITVKTILGQPMFNKTFSSASIIPIQLTGYDRGMYTVEVRTSTMQQKFFKITLN